ncbi:UDP-N-acetylmuramoyl-L-alanine--D-glutamate ligase [bacterium]|nr:UDP-N-acetylmuramoyl-L-alanine--D-glutamate ligase [bacterium]
MDKVLVMGLGVSGRESALFLQAEGFTVVLYDDNKEHLSSLSQEMKMESYNDNDAIDFSFAVVSPGISEQHPLFLQLQKKSVEIIGDIELAARYLPQTARVVAITGTNGKSTTVTLVRDMLDALGYSVFLCGNIGQPVISGVKGKYDIFVIELSSFQLDLLFTLRIDVAAVLNVSDDHLDRYDDFAAYMHSKLHIFELLIPQGRAIYNGDSIEKSDLVFDGDLLSFASEERYGDAHFSNGIVTTPRAFGTVARTPLSQPHNVENVKAALLIVDYFLSEAYDFTDVFKSFLPLQHRVQLVTEFNGISFYNDSKGTNTGASERALGGFSDGSVVLLLGGVDKGGSYAELRRLADEKCKGVVVFGEATAAIMRYFEGFQPLAQVNSMKDAVAIGYNLAQSEGTVLLSPACSSFDWYSNYKERGKDFVNNVKLLEEGHSDD